jgi:hypothetical protein
MDLTWDDKSKSSGKGQKATGKKESCSPISMLWKQEITGLRLRVNID